GGEGGAFGPAVIGHQTSIGRNDVAGTQCRIISNSWVDEAEGVPLAGAAGDDLLPVRERGGKLRVALAVWRDRVLDAVAVVDLGFARRTKRAAGLRRTYPAMTLDWEVTSVAQAHAVGDAFLGTGCFRAARRGGRIRIGDGGIPEATEQRLEKILGGGRSAGRDKHCGGDAGHEHALDAAAQAGLATDQQAKDSPQSRGSPYALSLINFSSGRKYDLRVLGLRSLPVLVASIASNK